MDELSSKVKTVKVFASEYRGNGLAKFWPAGIWVAILIAFWTCGCAKKAGPATPPQITFVIESTTATNNGQPFYVVIRSCNSGEFVTNSYESVAGSVFANPPDPNVLAFREILPGYEQKIMANMPETDAAGVYCLFTEPGDEWKTMLPQPLESKYEVTLGKNEIVKTERFVRKRKGFIQRIFSRD